MPVHHIRNTAIHCKGPLLLRYRAGDEDGIAIHGFPIIRLSMVRDPCIPVEKEYATEN
jgi:hypothetical protein